MGVTLRLSGFAILLVLLAGCATQSDNLANSSSPSPTQSMGNLTTQEYAFARKLVRSQIRRLKDVVTSASVAVGPGKVLDSNTGYTCTSGRLLHLQLMGDFIHIAISHPATMPGTPTPDYSVHAVILDADAKTGRACLIGVQIGKVVPEPGAVSLPLN